MKKFLFLMLGIVFLFGCSESPIDSQAVDQTRKGPDLSMQQTENVSMNSLSKSRVTDYDFDKYIDKGEEGSSWWHNNDGSHGYLRFYRYDDGHIYFYYHTYDSNGSTIEYGSGDIPYEDVSGSYDAGWFHLETNTSAAANPDFDRRTGNGGSIVMDWRRTSDYTAEGVGANKWDYGDYGNAYKGKWWRKSARTWGNVFGTSVSEDWDDIEKFENTHVYVWSN